MFFNARFKINIKIICLLIVCVGISSCKKDGDSDSFLDGPWVKTESGQVIVYSRPVGYSTVDSPNDATIQSVLKNQNSFLVAINQKLGVNYADKVSVYLFGKDEALAKIGMSGGGRSEPLRNEIYYTFSLLQYYPNWKLFDYVGAHEMVHIVSVNKLGIPGTAMMAEGYACALDGTFSSTDSSGAERRLLSNWMIDFRDAKQIWTPSDLVLNSNKIPEIEFYPQAGFFVAWLLDKYGAAEVNLLFTVSTGKFKSEFQKITGVSFEEMETTYLSEQK